MTAVLVIEDDGVIARAMGAHLRTSGFDFEWADDGTKGLRKLRFERPDVCVVDLMLPGLDGLGLIERARDEARAVGEIETQRRFWLRDFRPAPQSFAPPPLAGRDAEGASHERARHHAAREKHHPVGVVTISEVARAFSGLERGFAAK